MWHIVRFDLQCDIYTCIGTEQGQCYIITLILIGTGGCDLTSGELILSNHIQLINYRLRSYIIVIIATNTVTRKTIKT